MLAADKPSILLLENDPSISDSLTRLFSDYFQVTVIESPTEALAKIQSGLHPNIILSEWLTPRITGLEFLEKSQAHARSTMRLLLTEKLEMSDFSAAMEKGILHRVFLKPWNDSALLYGMQEVLHQQVIMKENLKLRRLAVTDSITELYNQRYFQEALLTEVKRAVRHSRPLSLLLIDVDRFKQVNDMRGHPYGDKILQRVAAFLKSGVRNIDIVCRNGGDEFAIILPDTQAAAAREVAERIRLTCANSDEGRVDNISLSIGVAEMRPKTASIGPLIDRADNALYQAKKAGKNQTMVADAN